MSKTIDRKTGVVMEEDVMCSLNRNQINSSFKSKSSKEVLSVFFSREESTVQTVSAVLLQVIRPNMKPYLWNHCNAKALSWKIASELPFGQFQPFQR